MQISELAEVAPLDAQVGVYPKRCVPPCLEDSLFPEAGPVRTFALIDAARILHLKERLADSGLPHQCFFKGDVLEEFGDAAPWLVELADENDFTRALFSDDPSTPDRFHWRKNAAIFIRSSGDLASLWRHLRKFTRLPAHGGQSPFFRFWEPRLLEAYVVRSHRLPSFGHMLRVIFGGRELFFSAPNHGSVIHMTVPPLAEREQLSPELRDELKRARFYSNMFEQAEDFHRNYPAESARYGTSSRGLWMPLFDAVDEIYDSGLSDATLRARFLMLAVIKYPEPYPAFCQQPWWQAIRQDPACADDRFRDLCAVLKRYSIRMQGAMQTWW